jgi:rubrerythrin
MDDLLNNQMQNQIPNSKFQIGEPGSVNNTAADTSAPVVESNEVIVDVSAPEDLDEIWTRWKCLKCGYNYEGRVKLLKCPRCGNEDPDQFEDAD